MSNSMPRLILYSKPGCHLCEGLQEKLEEIQSGLNPALAFSLEVRDITQQPEWFQAYQYEVPVLCCSDGLGQETPVPRPSPRLSVEQLSKVLKSYLSQP